MGSQAILGTFDDDELPDLVRLSRKLTSRSSTIPTERKPMPSRAQSERCRFHDTKGVYAEGGHIETA
jgi:hypothetical protein